MPKKSTIIKTVCCIILSSGYAHFAQAEYGRYRMPYQKDIYCSKDSDGSENCNFPESSALEIVKCSNTQNLTYCTDQSNQPITGEVLKFQDGLVSRRYEFKDGYLDGVGESFDNNGFKTAEVSYTRGQKNGYTNIYNRDGKLVSRIPYVNGKREGIAEFLNKEMTLKSIYIDNKLNGSGQIWNNKNRKKVYDVEMSSDYISSAQYHYYSNPDDTCCEYTGEDKINATDLIEKELNVPSILIDAVNLGCADIHEKFSCNPYPVKLKANMPGCAEWLKGHQKELKEVHLKLKCNEKATSK